MIPEELIVVPVGTVPTSAKPVELYKSRDVALKPRRGVGRIVAGSIIGSMVVSTFLNMMNENSKQKDERRSRAAPKALEDNTLNAIRIASGLILALPLLVHGAVMQNKIRRLLSKYNKDANLYNVMITMLFSVMERAKFIDILKKKCPTRFDTQKSALVGKTGKMVVSAVNVLSDSDGMIYGVLVYDDFAAVEPEALPSDAQFVKLFKDMWRPMFKVAEQKKVRAIATEFHVFHAAVGSGGAARRRAPKKKANVGQRKKL